MRTESLLVFWGILCVTGCVVLSGCQRSAETNSDTARAISIDPAAQPTNGEKSDGIDPGWPNLFGPGRQSHVNDPALPMRLDKVPTEIWRIDIGTGYSSPVLKGQRVFIAHRRQDQEIIECFSTEDGTSIWAHSFAAPYKCPYEYSSGPYSTPVLFDDKLIIVGQAGNTFCLRQQDGQVVWNRDLFQDFDMELGEWPVAASGIVVDDRFIFNLGAKDQQAGIIALSLTDGKTLWQSTKHEAGHATPNLMTLNEKTYVIMVTSNGLVSLDPQSGEECWFVPFRRRKAETYNAVSPVVFGNHVCMVTGPGPGTLFVEVDPTNQPNILWQDRRILDSQYTNLLCIDGFLFGFTPMKQGGPELRCVDLLQKKLSWKWKAKLGRAMMLACNETIIILGEKGRLAGVALTSAGTEELFRSESPVLAGPCYSAPALHAGKLYIRNEQHLVCLNLTPQ